MQAVSYSYAPKYLVMVSQAESGEADHNKVYIMTPIDDKTFQVKYGRVGAAMVERMYSRASWEKKIQEKLNKGYADVSEYHTSTVSGSSQYKEIACKSVKRIVDLIMGWANKAIKQNYTVTTRDVTGASVKKAQSIIDELSYVSNLDEFNGRLRELFIVIPRRMANVQSYLAKSSDDFQSIIDREQGLLDMISVGVSDDSKTDAAVGTKKTVLEENGLDIRECDDTETDMVISHLDPETQKRAVRVWHVVNHASRKAFDEYVNQNHISPKSVKYYYHGSKNPNYWNILLKGLKLHPGQNVSRTGAMFGHGLYFAPKAKKSVGYTSLNGTYWAHGNEKTALLLVFKVAMGKSKDVYQYDPNVARWTERECRKAGFDSVFAHASSNPSLGGGRLYNDECVVYNESACTISYMIELKS